MSSFTQAMPTLTMRTVSDDEGSVTAGPGEIIAMQKGDKVTIRSHEDGAVTAYVTYPHWQQPDA